MQPPGGNYTQYDRSAMAIHFEAVCEQGVLRPLEPLALAEPLRVHVTVGERTRWRPRQREQYALRNACTLKFEAANSEES